MDWKRLAALIAAATVTCATVVACGNNPKKPSSKPEGTFTVVTVNVDGRDVRCVTWKNGHGGGLECDWGAGR